MTVNTNTTIVDNVAGDLSGQIYYHTLTCTVTDNASLVINDKSNVTNNQADSAVDLYMYQLNGVSAGDANLVLIGSSKIVGNTVTAIASSAVESHITINVMNRAVFEYIGGIDVLNNVAGDTGLFAYSTESLGTMDNSTLTFTGPVGREGQHRVRFRFDAGVHH